MKTYDNHKLLKIISTSVVFLAMFVLPCVNIAKDHITLGFHSVQDPGQRLISRQNFDLALAFAFNPERFDRLWPDYGYSLGKIKNSIVDLCRPGTRNIDIGRSAIARTVPSQEKAQVEFVAIPIEQTTNLKTIKNFLNPQPQNNSPQPQNNQSNANSGGNDSTSESAAITIGDMCRILSGIGSAASNDTVIVTQHPLPLSERYSYRLLEEGIVTAEGIITSGIGSM